MRHHTDLAPTLREIAPQPHNPAKRFHRIARAVLVLAAFACVLHTPVFAQQPATISGFVADPSGAGVPGASLTLTNQDTAVVLTTSKSDSRGNFEFPSVPAPGSYSISVQVGGFTRHEQKDITVTAGERRSVGTISLAVGSINDSVTVQAATTPVQTESAYRSASLDRHEIGALLARGLNYGSLLRSLPGISGGQDPNGPGGNTTIYNSINGTRASATIPSIDGVNAADPSSQGQLYAAAATDSLVEINVKTSNYQAEYGGSAGAVINLVTRSGGKEFHGGLYAYLRNEDLNANSFFNNKNAVARPRYRYATGGGSIGGPVYIPGKFNRNKNKVFFFFNDQYSYQGNPGALQKLTVPTALERTGDFSQSVTTGGALIPINRPGTKTQYPGNIVPPSEQSALGLKLLSIFPQPNFTNRAVSGGNYNFLYQNTPTTRRNEYTYRVDFALTDKLRLYGRNNQINNSQSGYSIGVLPGPPWGLVQGFYNSHSTTPSINLVYTISPTLINELTFGINHWDEPGGPLDATQLAKAQRATYGLQSLGQWYRAANAYDYLPIMGFGDVPSAAGFSYDSRTPISGATTIFTFSDNITKVFGKHSIKAGVVFTRSRAWKGNQGSAFSGNFAFGKDVNNPLDSGYGYSNALLGIFDTYTESSARPAADFRSGAFEEYVQDSWKVNRRLTLEFGVRLTSWIPWHQRQVRESGFNPATWNPANASRLFVPGLNSAGTRVAVNPITGAQLPAVYIGAILPGVGSVLDGMDVAGTPGVPEGLTTVQRITPGPRFGFAYDLFGDGKTALRGGFGISALPQTQIDTGLQNLPPYNYTPKTYYGTLTSFLNTAGTLFPSNVRGHDWSQLAQSYSFSLGAQREVGFATVLDVAFVGNLGRHLLMSQSLNTLPYGARFLPASQDPTTGKPLPDSFLVPYAGLGSITFNEPIGTSNYYALQVQANRRFSRGFEFKANWTWSKSLDYGSGDGNSLPLYADRRLLSYGLSTFDRTFITNIAGLYEIPGSQRLSNPILKAALGNWNLSSTITMASGAPSGVGFSLQSGADIIGGGDGQRINVTGNPQLGYGDRNGNQFFNTSVFAAPPLGYIGSAGRVVFRGPGQNQWDLAAFKDFAIRERTKIQLRGEFYNAFNHTQWSSIDTTARFDAAGKQINGTFGQATGDRGGRVVQLALRVTF
ncbi:MAG: carboxypeptidase regulatory-like domain-containing protein [Acidobacteriota bacterium]